MTTPLFKPGYSYVSAYSGNRWIYLGKRRDRLLAFWRPFSHTLQRLTEAEARQSFPYKWRTAGVRMDTEEQSDRPGANFTVRI